MYWNNQFLELYERCLAKYKAGNGDFNTYYTEEDLIFLSSIGYKPRELFDFVEDNGDSGVPSASTALLVAAVRRDYFTVVQKLQPSSKEVTGNDVASKTETLAGLAYFPRIIQKAEAKLRGELHPNLMFGCGGDRRFLKEQNLPMADFLRNVWAADGDEQRIVEYVQSQKLSK